ncbi:MAG: phosphotransferase family protein [Pseudomonadaceae bacterium]|nr:phosphotransferase family protein [Pseudomonadaceae bacterium]
MDNFSEVIELQALTHWMTAQGLGSGPIENAALLEGGTQNFLLKFTRDSRDYVLRRPPQHLRKNSNSTMLREARVLEALAGSAVPHPGFIAVCDDESVLGASFYLMEPINGFNAANGLPEYHASDPAIRHRMGLAMVEGITALGAVDYKSVGLEGFGKPEGFLERQVPRWVAQLESYNQLEGWPGLSSLPGMDVIPGWLEANRPAEFTPGIMHGDYHLANVMFCHDSAELAAIVDWELCTIGDPLLDLGWLMAMWHDPEEQERHDQRETKSILADGFPTIEEMVDHYAQRTTRNLDLLGWYGVLACFKLGAILEGTYARACAGQAPVETGDALHAHTLDLFNRALRMIGKTDG